MELTAFKHPQGRGYLVYIGKLEKPDNQEPETMSKANLKFLEKRGAKVHWREVWSA